MLSPQATKIETFEILGKGKQIGILDKTERDRLMTKCVVAACCEQVAAAPTAARRTRCRRRRASWRPSATRRASRATWRCRPSARTPSTPHSDCPPRAKKPKKSVSPFPGFFVWKKMSFQTIALALKKLQSRYCFSWFKAFKVISNTFILAIDQIDTLISGSINSVKSERNRNRFISLTAGTLMKRTTAASLRTDPALIPQSRRKVSLISLFILLKNLVL